MKGCVAEQKVSDWQMNALQTTDNRLTQACSISATVAKTKPI